MNVSEYKKKVDSLNFNKEDYCIISGGVMLMYGLRESTSDIDLKISSSLFEKLNGEGSLTKNSKMDGLYNYRDDIELMALGFDQNNVVMVDGYPVETLEKQLEWKLAAGREKDQKDIELIQKYLKGVK